MGNEMVALEARIAQMRNEGRRKSFCRCAQERGSCSILDLIAGSYGLSDFFFLSCSFLKSYSFRLPYIVLLTFLYLISHLYFSKFLFGLGTGYWDGAGLGGMGGVWEIRDLWGK